MPLALLSWYAKRMSKFFQADRSQSFLLPPDLRDWIPEDDLAHFVIEVVERVDLNHFKVNTRGTRDAQYHPQLMLALLIYCYANGIFSSRRIERATYRDIGVRFVAANLHPDHDTLCKFRRENFEAISESFLQVLLLARELKLVRVGLSVSTARKWTPMRGTVRLRERRGPAAQKVFRESSFEGLF